MKNKMKITKILALFLMISLILSSCTSIDNVKQEAKPQDIKKSVVFNHYFSGSMSGGIDQMIAKLNSELVAYEVKAVPIEHESYKVRIREAIDSGNTADLYSYWAGAKTSAISNSIEDLSGLWSEMQLDQVFPKAIADTACTYNGKKMLIPITQHYVGIVYNKKIFEDLKISIPTDWESFNKACGKIKKAGITPIALGSKSKWPAQFWFDYILLRTSPFEYRQSLMNGKASYTDKEVIRSFQIWKELIDKGYFNDNPNEVEWDSGASNMLYNGQAAMTLMGTWIIGYYGDTSHSWTFGKEYDIFSFPVIDKNIEGCALGPIDGIVIPVKAHNKYEAMQTIGYFTNVENQKLMSLGSGAFAPSMMVEDSFYGVAQNRLLKSVRENPNWAFNYDLATPPDVAEIGLTAFEDFLQFPSEYRSILENIQKQIKIEFEK